MIEPTTEELAAAVACLGALAETKRAELAALRARLAELPRLMGAAGDAAEAAQFAAEYEAGLTCELAAAALIRELERRAAHEIAVMWAAREAEAIAAAEDYAGSVYQPAKEARDRTGELASRAAQRLAAGRTAQERAAVGDAFIELQQAAAQAEAYFATVANPYMTKLRLDRDRIRAERAEADRVAAQLAAGR